MTCVPFSICILFFFSGGNAEKMDRLFKDKEKMCWNLSPLKVELTWS